ASFMWGSSTRNSRIECLWVEVGTQFARRWRALCSSMKLINQDCSDFRAEWNCHPICGPDINDKSPKDLHFLGQMQFGVYRDDCEGVHPDVIEEYYGVHGPTMTRRQHQSGAGHPIDEEESDNEEEPLNMVQAINNQQRHQIHHKAISVPSQINPFTNDETRWQFSATLIEVIAKDITPCDCRLAANEWEGDEYPIFEAIPVGQQGLKELHVSLAELSWFNQGEAMVSGITSVVILFSSWARVT
ncbi:hypothetical protein DFJ58DRAFT_663184, partial [Suillus subalutaceus]|uniref:uncharacterized protein n=1 Tax=Suillus subalutaceus TaxID=48586 RepID=UPI001B861166